MNRFRDGERCTGASKKVFLIGMDGPTEPWGVHIAGDLRPAVGEDAGWTLTNGICICAGAADSAPAGSMHKRSLEARACGEK